MTQFCVNNSKVIVLLVQNKLIRQGGILFNGPYLKQHFTIAKIDAIYNLFFDHFYNLMALNGLQK